MRRAGLWLLFFLICFGLGYPTLNRYDPRTTGGLSDTQAYYEIAAHGPANVDTQLRGRVLVPFLARAVTRVARNHTGGWEPVFFGFLVVNSFFTATAASLLVAVARRVAGGEAVGLMGALLYLLNFETSNVVLSGMVDSSDGCFLMATVWSLVSGRLWWLPVWGVLGAAGKETFVPVAIVFVLAWWAVEKRGAGPAIGLALAALAGVTAVQSAVAGHLVLPWEFAASVSGPAGHWRAFLENTADRGVLLMAMWMVPLGIPRLRKMPRAWVAASGAGAATAIALAVWHSSTAGAAARPLFSVAGPLLSLSAARYLGEPG